MTPEKKLPPLVDGNSAGGLKQHGELSIPIRAEYGKPYAEEEKKLSLKVLEYEKAYFEDMTFQPESITGDIFVECEQHIFSKRKNKEYWPLPESGFDLSISQCSFKIKRIKGAQGRYNHKSKTVFIHPEFNVQATILHEMVHVYDFTLDLTYPYPLRDIVLIQLYNKLKGKIKDLNRLIMVWAHYPNQHEIICSKEGEHGVLFMLKCLDLELRIGFPFGEISGFYFEKKIKGIGNQQNTALYGSGIK
jgi:hypothetical protein